MRMPIDPQSINKPVGTTFDLVLGANPKTDVVMLCNLSGELTQAIPVNSLRQLLEPASEVCQVEQLSKYPGTIVMLTYSEPNETYCLVAAEVKEGRFAKIDSIHFKKGNVVHTFTVINMDKFEVTKGKVNAKMLVVIAYNGSKLKEFTFGVDKAQESRVARKVQHKLNLRFHVAQVLPYFCSETKALHYMVRASNEPTVHLVKPGSASDRKAWLDTSEVLRGKKSQVQLVTVADQARVLTHSGADASLLLYEIKSLDVGAMVSEHLKKGLLQTALNIVRETGKGCK